MNKIFLDHASTTSLHPEVIQLMTKVLSENYGNPSSIHSHGRSAKMIIEKSRKTVARLLHAAPSEIFFMSSATEANNTILKNCVAHLGIDTIISTPTEHPCILRTLEYLTAHHDVKTVLLSVDNNGNIDTEELRSHLEISTASTMVSIMHGNNEIGTIHDIKTIGGLCAQYNRLYHCDAVQTIGKLPIDLNQLNADFLSGSAHKFRGPKGSAFFYVNKKHNLPPYIHGGSQERNMRAGTENTSGIAGLAKALELSLKDPLYAIHVHNLRLHMKEKLLQEFPHIIFNGNQDTMYLPHILSASFPPHAQNSTLLMNLDILGVSVSSASACSAGVETDSHVLQAIGHDPDRKTVRFSFGQESTIEEVDRTVEHITKIYSSHG